MSIWTEAALRTKCVEVWIAPAGDGVLIVEAGTLSEADGVPVEEREIREVETFSGIGCSRLPGELGELAEKDGVRALIGPGYVLFIPVSAKCAYAALPTVLNDSSKRLSPSLGMVAERLPRFKATGFKEYSVMQAPRTQFFDIHGLIWHAAEIADGSQLHVTRFSDGLRIVKVPTGTPAPDGEVWTLSGGTRRVGLRAFRGLLAKMARVVYAEGILCVLSERVSLAEFGISKNRRSGDKLPLQKADGTERLDALRNTTIYPLMRTEPRLQVQGAWLSDYGFEPGTRFTIEPHPAFPLRKLLRITEDGEHTVTQHHGPGTSKLYIPMHELKHFSSREVRVWGNVDGLHVQRYFRGKASSKVG